MAAGTATTGGPEAEAASLRGELCCVDTEPGLRPFTGHSSPGGKEAKDGMSQCNSSATVKHNQFSPSNHLFKSFRCSHRKNSNFAACISCNSALTLPPQGFSIKVKYCLLVCHLTGLTLV